MTTPQDLVEFHEIAQLKYRYLRALDTQDWALMETCFVEDARVWYGDGAYSFVGRTQIIDFFPKLLTPDFVSSHIVVHPELTLTGPGAAEGVWRLQDIVHFTAANPTVAKRRIEGGEEMTGAAYYYDEYRKEDGGWKIASSGFVRIFESLERRAARAHIDLTVDPQRGLRT